MTDRDDGNAKALKMAQKSYDDSQHLNDWKIVNIIAIVMAAGITGGLCFWWLR